MAQPNFVPRDEFERMSQEIVAIGDAVRTLLAERAQPAREEAQEEQAAPRPTPRPIDNGRLKLMRPKSYTGQAHPGAVENFLFDCRQYFLGMEVSDPDKRILFAVSLLEGVAKSWWRFYAEQIGREHVAPILTWENFEAKLQARFCVVNAVHGARDKLDSLRQIGSVRSYISAFQNLLMQIPEMTEGEGLHRFKQGLQFRIKKEVALREPNSLEDAMRLAEKYDALLYSVQGGRPTQRAPPVREASRAWMSPVLPVDTPTSMEIDALQRKPLTQEDREHLRKVGGCFYCRRTGHLISTCPLRERSNSMRRPTNQVVTMEDLSSEQENPESQ